MKFLNYIKSFCKECKKDCCLNNPEPPLTNTEVQKIEVYTSMDRKKFTYSKNENVFIKNLEGTTQCYFCDDSHCTIYDARPVGCVIYPFDFAKSENNFFWVLSKQCPLGKDRERTRWSDITDIVCDVEKFVLKKYTQEDIRKMAEEFEPHLHIILRTLNLTL